MAEIINPKLIQRKTTFILEFEIETTGIRKKINVLGLNLSNTLYHFEEIGANVITERRSKVRWLLGAVAALIIVISLIYERSIGEEIGDNAEVIWAGVGLISFFIYILSRKNLLLLTGGTSHIEFFMDYPSDIKVKSYIDYLIITRNAYLKKQYAQINNNYPLDGQINILDNLRNQNIITESEYIKFLAEINDQSQSEPVVMLKENIRIPVTRTDKEAVIHIISIYLSRKFYIDNTNEIAEKIVKSLEDSLLKNLHLRPGIKYMVNIIAFDIRSRIPITYDYSIQLTEELVRVLNHFDYPILSHIRS